MIVDLPDTTTSKVSKMIMTLREQGGVTALGRVLTLVVVTTSGLEEEAIGAANDASREHPCRIIVLAGADARADAGVGAVEGADAVAHPGTAARSGTAGSQAAGHRLDAQIRVGGDAGASEVIVLRGYGRLAREDESLIAALLLPDAPIVAWWPHGVPENGRETSIGAIAHRRITDSANDPDPRAALERIHSTYRAGDTDLAWTRLTNWRIRLAAALDHIDPSTVLAAEVEGAPDSPSPLLMAAWLGAALDVPVAAIAGPVQTGLRSVRLILRSGEIRLKRPGHAAAELAHPGQPAQRITLPRRSLRDCLAEELRRLDPDPVFGEVLAAVGRVTVEHDGGKPAGAAEQRDSLVPA